MKILVIIPAKDEGTKIAEVVEEVKKFNYDVLVVDDGSRDDTAVVAQKAGAQVLRHCINRGQGAALKTGISYALGGGYEVVVFFDADGQMAAEEIGLLISTLNEKSCQVVLGSRFMGRTVDMPMDKKIVLKLALLFTRFTTGLRLTDVHNGFQVWTATALKRLQLKQDRQAYASELLQEIADKKFNYVEVPVTIRYTSYSKKKGQSIFNAFNIVWDLIIKK